MSRKFVPVTLALVGFSLPSLAEKNVKFECTAGTTVRTIEVVYQNPDAKVPCSVLYTKAQEGQTEPQTLWSAANQEDYCWEKAKTFLEKLGNAGWNCQEMGDATAASERPKSEEVSAEDPKSE